MDRNENHDKDKSIKNIVREKYADIARATSETASSCCSGSPSLVNIIDMGKALDYAEEDLLLAPGEANLGLGCGNPIGMAELKEGETVLDLGSGAGFDSFLAAKKVDESGKVVGVDMTSEMIEKATKNAEKLGISNAEFRFGEIENIPVEDSSIDVVISNCVINLSTDKSAVFGEIYRTLKPGGRIIISDILRSGEIPKEIKDNPAFYTGWVSGAISPGEVETILSDLGFRNINITAKEKSRDIIKDWNVGKAAEIVFSAYIQAEKPK